MFFANSPPQTSDDATHYGIVKSVDYAAGLAIVDLGEIDTPPLPWGALATHVLKIWIPIFEGDQVKINAPNGDFEGALIEHCVFTDADMASCKGQNIKIELANDDSIILNPLTGKMDIHLSQPIDIHVPQYNLTGDLNVTGTINATTDVIGGGKSLKTHKHTTVKAGTDISGAPQ